ncbi:LysM peptidoglycan-binding domain-containing protein [Arthrobacter sp. AK01]|uniref:LysM peptidoglycan-binding domain-containing protein n=1 Tax=Arthrobacter sp. AK01 TaxID=2894084 RepID=UPI001E65D186|nr:LysM domain-containing protein [Arthrobacter sp. AK01]MCD4850662.1 LysM peptidoglycan-binding domain-containing protein [Arthrobacter sp. AK01]
MGLLDNVRKNLGFGNKVHGENDHRDHAAPEAAPDDQTAVSQAAEDAAAVEVSAQDKAAAEAAAAQAAQQQATADAAAAQEAEQEGLEPGAPEVRPQAQEAASEAAAGSGQPGPVAPRVTEVVVEQGDTMGGIAAQFGVDLGALIATNADTVPNPDRIYPGQVLRLP